MKYVFEFVIHTDGDFSFRYVPAGTDCNDAPYTYEFKKNYLDRDVAIKDILSVCHFLNEHMNTSRDHVRRNWGDCIYDFTRQLQNSEYSQDERIESGMYGNYDGTLFSFRAEPNLVKCDLQVNDEELEVIRKHRDKVSTEDIKNAILNLYKHAGGEVK